jgi:hypothetical protein
LYAITDTRYNTDTPTPIIIWKMTQLNVITCVIVGVTY